jgi:phage baseplate assembly protein W
MIGMNRETGKYLEGEAHLKQSIRDILTTAVGERLIVRKYGSNVFQYIDKPLNDKTRIEIISVVANAIHDFEPRVKLVKVGLENSGATAHEGAHLTLRLEGYYEEKKFLEHISI